MEKVEEIAVMWGSAQDKTWGVHQAQNSHAFFHFPTHLPIR